MDVNGGFSESYILGRTFKILPGTVSVQFFELTTNRGIVHSQFKAVTFNGRLPWESETGLGPEDQIWGGFISRC